MKFQLIRKYHLTRPLMAAAQLAATRLTGSRHDLTLNEIETAGQACCAFTET